MKSKYSNLPAVTDEMYAEMVKKAEKAKKNGHTYTRFEFLGVLEELGIELNGNSFDAVEKLYADGFIDADDKEIMKVINKDGKEYGVKELTDKWTLERKLADGKLTVSFEVSKMLCETEQELFNYVTSNDIF